MRARFRSTGRPDGGPGEPLRPRWQRRTSFAAVSHTRPARHPDGGGNPRQGVHRLEITTATTPSIIQT